MARTVAELREAILSYGFAETQYTTHVTRWIDEAQRMIFRRANLRNKEIAREYTTEVGKDELELPSDFAQVTYLLNKTAPQYNMESAENIKAFNEYAESSGQPTAYIIDTNKIKVWPTPDAAYVLELRYKKIPSSIVSESSSSPSIAEDYYNLIEEYALAKAYSKENDVEEANYHNSNFEKLLIEFTGQMDHATDDTQLQIQGSMEANWYGE